MNIGPKYFLLGLVVGLAILFAAVGINKSRQGDFAMVMGVQDKSTPTPTLAPTSTPTPTPTPTPTIMPIPEPYDAISLVLKYAGEYGVDDNILFTIGQCESGFNTTSVNGPYGGIYQFHYLTWASIRNLMGLDPNSELRFNPEESIRTAAFKVSKDGAGAWPACSGL